MIVWILGLSGSGKSTLAKELLVEVRRRGRVAVLLDGDEVRLLYGDDLGHDLGSRKISSERISRLAKFLEAQNLVTIVANVSMFPEHRQACKESSRGYFEVFIDVPLSVLAQRDSKGIYSDIRPGTPSNVAGVDLEFPVPSEPDLVIQNTSTLLALLSYARKIADEVIY